MPGCNSNTRVQQRTNAPAIPSSPHVWAQCQSRSAWRHLDEVRAPWAHPDTQLQAFVSRRPPAATGMRWKHRHVLRLPPQDGWLGAGSKVSGVVDVRNLGLAGAQITHTAFSSCMYGRAVRNIRFHLICIRADPLDFANASLAAS